MVDDPIFIPILQLEMDKKGHPAEFAQVVKDMQLGKTGRIRIENARKGRGKVRRWHFTCYQILWSSSFTERIWYYTFNDFQNEWVAATYYYAALDESEYSFAFSLSDTDKVRQLAEYICTEEKNPIWFGVSWKVRKCISTYYDTFYSNERQVFRRVQEPADKSKYEKSYFNLLIEYDSDLARKDLPGTFEYLQVRT